MGLLDQLLIRVHLARVEARLRRTDTSQLSTEQRNRRRWAVDELHRYWRKRSLPRNTYGVRRTPVFEDETGRRCAVAQLVWASGNEAIVARVRDQHNLARIPDISYRDLARWAADHGLRIDELAAIQPAYSVGPDPSTTMWTALLGTLGVAACGIGIVGLVVRSRLWSVLGRVASLVALGLAVAATVIVLRFNAGPCEGICRYYERPGFARGLLTLLWSASGIVAVKWIQRWRSTDVPPSEQATRFPPVITNKPT